MAISVFASFRAYILSSLLLTTAVVSHAVYTKRFFYRSVVHLANSKLAVLAVANMGLCSILCLWRLIQSLFLGQLRFRERERLHLRARDAIIESCFAISVFREDFNAVFVCLVMTLLLLKSLHWLAKDRIEFLEEQPLSPRSAHIRVVSLMALLFTIDAIFVARSVANTYAEKQRTMYALFAFESAILMVDLLSHFVHYVFLVIDLSMDGRWEGKWLYSFYSELISDMCQLTVYILFFIYVQIHYSFPYHIIRELYMTFYKFQRRCSDFLRYRRVVATMNDIFADATEEQLAQGDRTCIICREEMTSAKVLSCGHMFHARCLQSWLKRQLTCPTCRATIDVNPNPRNQPNAPGNQPDNANNNNINNNLDAFAAGAGPQPAAGVPAPPPNNAPVPPGGMPPAGAAAPPGEAGARLLDAVNDWWQALLNDAGGAPAVGANGRRPRPPLPPRPAQPEAAGQPGFLRGPNAVAHLQFRMRQRAAWPRAPPIAGGEMQGGQAVGGRGAPDVLGAANGENANQMGAGSGTNAGSSATAPSVALSGGSRTDAHTSSNTGTPPVLRTTPVTGVLPTPAGGGTTLGGHSTEAVASEVGGTSMAPGTASVYSETGLPLERLLAVQEQIEVLRAEVQSLVELVTTEPSDNIIDGSNSTTTARTTLSNAATVTTATSPIEEKEESGEEPNSQTQDSNTSAGCSAEVATEVVDEKDEEVTEAERMRRRRIEFLERNQAR